MKDIIEKIKKLAAKGAVTIAVDGNCGAGKTTFAAAVAKESDCNVFHMDDFFLQPHQRTPERYSEAGGNADRERIASEILLPIKEKKAVCYRPFECKRMALGEEIKVCYKALNIIEGTYSCHPELWEYCDLHIFMETDFETQLERLALRGADLKMFREKWIPLENRYFEVFGIKDRCEITIKT